MVFRFHRSPIPWCRHFQAAIPAGSHATVIFCLVRIRVIAGDTLLWLKALNTACTLPLNLTGKIRTRPVITVAVSLCHTDCQPQQQWQKTFHTSLSL